MLALWSDHCPNFGLVLVKFMFAVMVLLISACREHTVLIFLHCLQERNSDCALVDMQPSISTVASSWC